MHRMRQAMDIYLQGITMERIRNMLESVLDRDCSMIVLLYLGG